MDLTPGSVFAGYVIERRIGAGGMGAVYVARHPRLPRSVALKILTSAPGDASQLRARFEQEADLIAQLDHPNVVEIYDRGTEGDLLWITMRLVDGSDVAHMVAPGRPIRPVHRAVGIAAQAAAGLDAAHRRGLLHRDVKPANLLVAAADDGSDHVFVTDFGIARSIEGPRLTSTGSIVATLAYASPEQIGAGRLDHRTDIYSLGATLYEMLTGEPPFAGRPPLAVLNAHLNEPPPLPSRIDPTLPPDLDRVIATAMAKDPNLRFDTCEALAAAAWRALGPVGPATGAAPALPVTQISGGGPPWSLPDTRIADGSGPPPGMTSPTGVPPSAGRHQRLAVIALGVVAVILVGVIVGLLTFGPQRGDSVEAGRTSGIGDTTTDSAAPTTSAANGSGTTGSTPDMSTPDMSTPDMSTPDMSTTDLPTTTASAPPPAPPPFPAWGRAGELVALFPELLPATPDGVGYQGARCESLDVVNNGGMPALQCTGDEGLLWYVWSFRPGDPRREDTFTTNYDNDTTIEQPWQRPSGTGMVRTTDGPSTSGVLTVSFDDPARRSVIIDVGSWSYNGRGLFDRWWATAPI